MDTALNFPCKKLLKNLLFLCQLGVWLVKSWYSVWRACKGTAELAKNENCKIWDRRSLLRGGRLVFTNEWKNWRWQDSDFCRIILSCILCNSNVDDCNNVVVVVVVVVVIVSYLEEMSGDFLWIYSISVRCSLPQAASRHLYLQLLYPHQGHHVSGTIRFVIPVVFKINYNEVYVLV